MTAAATLHLLTGPTAVGKTEWALRWAERHGAEIVSCDSLLVYRGMDIGTAKPTREELQRVPHHLIDCREITDPMDVVRYVTEARRVVDEILARGHRVLVTGGSGFYLRAFLAPVSDDVAIDPAVRTEVTRLPLAEALERLRSLNPDGLGALDTANPRRVARALERCVVSGRTLRELTEEFSRRPGAFDDFRLEVTRLDREPVELAGRIERRVDAMLAAGLVDEVKRLLPTGLAANPSASRAIGYREVIAMLAGEVREEDLRNEIIANTRALVKKQRTWFRTQLPPHRVVPAAELGDVDALFTASPARPV
ncbi:MAG: tRNA (adenosine(37)-N6)-dimethylallyltransferase MiaA [Opitutaceae bacterium]